MEQKQMELMRSLVAAQAALFDVMDSPQTMPGAKASRTMLAIMAARIAQLSYEVTGMRHREQ